MCLGIPMRIVKRHGDEGFVEAGGLRRKANLSFMKNARIGDYVIVHAGFAIERVDEREAKKTLKALKDL